MTKSMVAMSIDPDVWNKVKMMFPHKISSMVNDYLRSLIAFEKRDVDGVQIEIERLKLQTLTENITKMHSEIEEKTQIIAHFEQKVKKKVEKDLENEKKVLENEGNCDKCGGNTGEKPFNLGKKQYCKECFMDL